MLRVVLLYGSETSVEGDQGTEAEVAGVHQQEPEEHPGNFVAQKNL